MVALQPRNVGACFQHLPLFCITDEEPILGHMVCIHSQYFCTQVYVVRASVLGHKMYIHAQHFQSGFLGHAQHS